MGKELLRSLRADPNHAPENITDFAVKSQAAQARQYAQRQREAHPEASPAQLSAEARRRTVRIAGIDGAVSGTPFFIALVPAYVAMLWEQARMYLQIAALYGRDVNDPAIAAELLWLRGVYPSVEEAKAELATLEKRRLQVKPSRETLGVWVALARRFLVLGGFIEAPDPNAAKGSRLKTALSVGGFAAIWIVTCVVPVTFMLLMAFGCISGTKTLAGKAVAFYGEAHHTSERPPPAPPIPLRTRILRGALIALSVGVPLGALAVAVTLKPAGVDFPYVLIALVCLSLVITLAVMSARR